MPAGRPPKYDPKRHPVIILALYTIGKTDQEVADAVGISRTTLDTWRSKYPELLDTTKEGKAVADQAVADSLYAAAIGGEYEEVTHEAIVDGEGQVVGHRKVKRMKKMMPANVAAQCFWLKNRRPDLWRDRHDITIGDARVVLTPIPGPGDNGESPDVIDVDHRVGGNGEADADE